MLFERKHILKHKVSHLWWWSVLLKRHIGIVHTEGSCLTLRRRQKILSLWERVIFPPPLLLLLSFHFLLCSSPHLYFPCGLLLFSRNCFCFLPLPPKNSQSQISFWDTEWVSTVASRKTSMSTLSTKLENIYWTCRAECIQIYFFIIWLFRWQRNDPEEVTRTTIISVLKLFLIICKKKRSIYMWYARKYHRSVDKLSHVWIRSSQGWTQKMHYNNYMGFGRWLMQ